MFIGVVSGDGSQEDGDKPRLLGAGCVILEALSRVFLEQEVKHVMPASISERDFFLYSVSKTLEKV